MITSSHQVIFLCCRNDKRSVGENRNVLQDEQVLLRTLLRLGFPAMAPQAGLVHAEEHCCCCCHDDAGRLQLGGSRSRLLIRRRGAAATAAHQPEAKLAALLLFCAAAAVTPRPALAVVNQLYNAIQTACVPRRAAPRRRWPRTGRAWQGPADGGLRW